MDIGKISFICDDSPEENFSSKWIAQPGFWVDLLNNSGRRGIADCTPSFTAFACDNS